MAVSRLTQTTLQNGFEKYNQLWDGRSAVGSMEAISSITLSAAQSSVQFNNIPGTYTHLQLRGFNVSGSAIASLSIRFNSDTGSNYARHNLEGTGSSAIAEASPNDTIIRAAYTGGTSNPSVFVMDILDYANTNKFKTTRSLSGIDQNGSGYVNLWSGLWRSTNAITNIDVFHGNSTFNADSSFTLYGIK